MSRHHPYSGYDESPRSNGGHRKNGFKNRGAAGRGNNFAGRPSRRASVGGGAGGGGGGASGGSGGGGGVDAGAGNGGGSHNGFGGSHSSSNGSNKSGWDPASLNSDSHKNRPFERELAHVPRGPSKNFKNRGSLRAKLRASNYSKLNPPERELSIDERVQKERPCRTLFVRNVKYETDSQEVRHKFEQMGEIKIFFDLISTRGMAFITYYDLRAATMAKQRLQGTDLSGRPIDVHYSLPKDNELEGRIDRDKHQATLFLSISQSNRPIDDAQLRAKFEVYGEIRSIKPFRDSPYQRFVEFWDTRACEHAHESLDGSHYLGGEMVLKFAWDTGMVPKGRPEWRAGQDEHGFYRPGEDEYSYEHDEPSQYKGAQVRQQDPRNGHAPQDPYRYNASHAKPPPGPLGKEIDERRLDQAHKVQELLASLTKAGSADSRVGTAPLVNNYPSEPPKLNGGGFMMGTALPSNFVPNYPVYPVAPAPMAPAPVAAPVEYGQPHPGGQNQLAQIMGQLSSFSSAAAAPPSHPQQPPHLPHSYGSTINSSHLPPSNGLGLPPFVMALLQQNPTGVAGSAAPQTAVAPQPKPAPSIPTAPRAMQAQAMHPSSTPSHHPPTAQVPPAPAASYPAAPAQLYNSSSPASNPPNNSQAAVQQLLALLQQQQQQKQQ